MAVERASRAFDAVSAADFRRKFDCTARFDRFDRRELRRCSHGQATPPPALKLFGLLKLFELIG